MFIKVELDAGLSPWHVAFLRCAFGAPALLLILAITRDRLPRGRDGVGPPAGGRAR